MSAAVLVLLPHIQDTDRLDVIISLTSSLVIYWQKPSEAFPLHPVSNNGTEGNRGIFVSPEVRQHTPYVPTPQSISHHSSGGFLILPASIKWIYIRSARAWQSWTKTLEPSMSSWLDTYLPKLPAPVRSTGSCRVLWEYRNRIAPVPQRFAPDSCLVVDRYYPTQRSASL